jgi:uncharacterized protein YfaS (alpha-2-macroglobulin family)
VLTYFGLERGETKTFRIFVNKSYAGEYFLPAISAEVMYKPELYAVIPGRPLRKLSLPPTTAPRGGGAPRL